LVDKVQYKLSEKQIDHTFSFGNNLQLHQEKNTILICHSFSCFFALLHCKYDFKKNIQGCVFINGNFNQRQKMPYTGIRLASVQQPILMLLNNRDQRLPIAKALDDLYVRCDEQITNKFFMVNQGTHFSSFTHPDEIETVSNQICDFIESIDRQNFTAIHTHTENLAR
jgi:predicted alpha/beta hydrolase family esterase